MRIEEEWALSDAYVRGTVNGGSVDPASRRLPLEAVQPPERAKSCAFAAAVVIQRFADRKRAHE